MHMINMHTTNPDGVTPYAALHGKKAVARYAEFGEQVFWHVPKKARSKLCLRWRIGTFLGVSGSSNEVYVADASGQVLKTRSIARVVASNRWVAQAVLGVSGTPGNHTTVRAADASSSHIEEHEDPHVDADAGDRALVDVEDEERKRRAKLLVRITQRDLRLYGYHDGYCPKCSALQRGQKNNVKHSDECLLRLYLAFKEAGDYKYQNVKHIVEGGEDGEMLGCVVGKELGLKDGINDGFEEGRDDGSAVGIEVGEVDG